MEKIRFAVLGTGGRGRYLAEQYAAHPQVEFVACCDTADGFAEETVARFKATTGKEMTPFTSYEEMSKKAVYDAVLIACDPDIQVDYAVAEMERGIHVMTEVPAAYSIDQCWALVNAVKRTGCKYQLAEQTRYWHFVDRWRRMAADGEFGKILYAEGEYLHYAPSWDYFRNVKTGHRVVTHDPSYHNDPEWTPSWRYRTFMDPILYLPHELSPLLSITGGRIERVSCLGTKRTVESARSTLDTPKMFIPGEGWTAHPEWGTADKDAPEEFRNAGHGGADYYPLFYFVDAILNDKTPPMDVYRSVETAAPAILARESANRGGILLEVPDFRV